MGSNGLLADSMDDCCGRMGPFLAICRNTDVGSDWHVSGGKSDGEFLPSLAALMVALAQVPSSLHRL